MDRERSLPQLSGVRIPESVRFTDDLERACKEATVIVCATASHPFGASRRRLPAWRTPQIIVCATKGGYPLLYDRSVERMS